MASSKGLHLAGQTAIVTGSSSGIGAGTARELASAGADVVINFHDSERDAEAVVVDIEAMGRRSFKIAADVSSEPDVIAMFDEAETRLGPIDIVVSNAGMQKDAPIAKMGLDDWNAVIGINLTGAFLVGREAVRRFRGKGPREDVSPALGKLVFVSSVHQTVPWAFHANYAASKGGIDMLMRSIAQEVAAEKIRVNSVAPGAIATAINADERENDRDAMLELIPYGRIGEPTDVGRAVAWMVSDAADYLNGQTIFLDGGMTLYPGFKGNG
ncbi:SDR family oxidoreductase [Aurantimonas marianensis]|uniref:SDR family oxidoreductase n=1 Tax=Aurantimonas marianensis TaxID=2920428 RepID=A0A9X2KE41_9HYPH|nr:SDR family oxidoreductase [Aurantimonas marianensis]MCP3054264.1 SDR family oxidoreductase [Aurantimonas marianensis]